MVRKNINSYELESKQNVALVQIKERFKPKHNSINLSMILEYSRRKK